MRGRSGVALVAVAAGLAVPASAQLAGETPLARQTYAALTEGGDVRATSALLRDSLNSLGGNCTKIVRYQLFRQTVRTSTLKVACADHPIYLLSIDSNGRMLVDGGDGRITPMDAADGVILDVPDREVVRLSPPAAVQAAALPTDMPMGGSEAPLGWMRWLFALMALLVAVIAFTIYRAFTISEVVTVVGPAMPYRRYSSEDKDQLIAESRQRGRNFWVHPSGLYIVRGRNGKRRLFPSWMWAQAYRIWGVKIRQIR